MIAGFHIQENTNKNSGSDRAHESIGSGVIGKFDIGNLTLKLYSKVFVDTKPYIGYKDRKITCIGLFFYKNRSLEEALSLFLKDFIKGTIEWNSLSGTYAILIWNDSHVEIILDTFVVQSVFVDTRNRIIGSSFLGILDSNKELTINKEAFLETILTGNLIGPETLVNEINRVEKDCSLPCFENLKISFTPVPKDIIKPRNRDQAMSLTLEKLKNCISSIERLTNDSGLVTGITGGLDSRLILALALEKIHPNKIGLYTNCRDIKGKEKVIDEPLAERVAESVGKTINSAWMVHPLDLTEKEFSKVTHNSFLLFDGQARMHVQFFEEYNNSEFKRKVHKEYFLGISGIGGEIFRNHEGMVSKYWTMDKFIKYRLVKNFLGDCFLSQKDEIAFFDKLESKITTILKIKNDRVYQKDIKKFYNLILVPYRLGIRNNAENRLFHFYSPFIDPSTVYQGFENIKYLGSSISFEKDLICKLNKQLANVQLDYGIKPNEKISNRLKFKPYIRSIIPDKLYVSFRINNLRKPHSYIFERNMNSKFLLFKDAIKQVRELNLPINIDALLSSPDTMPIIYNLGYFLIRFNSRNYFDNI
jgi:hypothetical protein